MSNRAAETPGGGMLADLRVVEIATWVAAPTVGAILAEYGADVIRIENPGSEDPARASVTQAWKNTVPDAQFNSSYELNNRNKRSLAISLKTDTGRAVFRRLIATSDIFVTNLLPDRQARLGVDAATLRALNERLIHVSISGWGTKGPFRLNRGFDYTVFWAASSLMHLLRAPNAPPPLNRPGMGDRPTGLAATAALGLALHHRERTGQGQAIEVNLMHTGMWTAASDLQRAVVFGTPGPSYGRDAAPSPLHNNYQTRDGRWLILLVNEGAWPAFCACIEEPQLADDPRFANADQRSAHNTELIALLDAAFARHDLAEWTRRLNEAEMTWAPGLEPLEAARHPQAVENEFFIDAKHSAVGDYKMLTFPFKLSAAKPRFRNQAPETGADTREILTELGFDPTQIEELTAAGVVGT